MVAKTQGKGNNTCMNGTTLLYIDDDQMHLKLIGSYFKSLGFKVLTASDGRQGLKVFRKENPDIVLTDLAMPEIDGLEVLETVGKEAPETPVIVISGQGEMPEVIKALRLGAWNYLTKPIDDYVLVKYSIDNALERAHLKKEIIDYQKGLEEKVRQRTRELEQSEKKLSAIIEAFDGFIFICDNNCRITYMNPALKNHIGHDATGEVCHKSLFAFDEKCPWCFEELLSAGQVIKEEFKSPRDNRWYWVVQTPLLSDDGQINQSQVILYDITAGKQAVLDLQERENYLRKENLRLRASLSDRYQFGEIVGNSAPMQEVYELILNAAATDANVIIYGESGTGKELVAKSIHENCDRKDNQLVYVNCGAIPENLVESEFFGYKKGAFTGASKDKHGYLDLAAGGTLFLDEVGDIPMNLQIKLLRAIEGGGYTPVGGSELKKPDVRIIAATNRDLKEAVRQGLIRPDFLYRIHVIPIHLPPLCKRRDDIPLLIEHFLSRYNPETVPPLTPNIINALKKYNWPGNVRELHNTLKRWVTLKKLDFMEFDIGRAPEEDVVENVAFSENISLSDAIEALEIRLISKRLEENHWHKGDTANALRIDPKTLTRKIKQYNIKKPAL
jgi:PAS domain S-box-containing protein